MTVEVKVPSVGESVEEGLLAEWLKGDGEAVAADEPLYVLETDKVTMTVNAEAAGRLEIVVPAGETVRVGQVVARIDPDAAGSTPPREEAAPAAGHAAGSATPPPVPEAPHPEPGPPLTVPAGAPQAAAKLEAAAHLSPAVRRLVLERGLDPARIPATGPGGRITKEDVLRHLQELDAARTAPAAEAPGPAEPAGAATAAAEEAAPATARAAAGAGRPRQTRRKMSPLRLRLAERLVQAQRTAAMLTTFNEADMSRVLELRARWREAFEREHGVRLGLMSFFVKAAVRALQDHPEVNAFIEGDEIVTNHYYDIGIAVSTERGLVVPVLRDADRLSFAGIERGIATLAERARTGKLTLYDLAGGVFTITNGGVFGSLLSTPILNPPQSAILGMHAIQKRPVVVGPDDRIEVRPMMYLALSYDHRLIDGREAVAFLRRIVECLEDPERLLLEV